MARAHTDGSYHAWRSFLQCPDCGSNDVTLDYYEDGTMFNCQECGAEAWAATLKQTET